MLSHMMMSLSVLTPFSSHLIFFSLRWDLLDSARRAPTPQEPSNAFFQDFGPQICCPSLRTQIQEQQSKLVLVELNLNQSLLAQARLRHLVQDLTTEVRTWVLDITMNVFPSYGEKGSKEGLKVKAEEE